MDFKTSSKIWSTNLKASEKMVLLALDHSGDQDGFSWQGYAKLAEMTDINAESKYLTRILNKLEKEGYILIWRQHGHKGGRGYTHIYWPIIGRTDEEILEIVMRRFIATEDEARAIISQGGPIYDELVKRNRVSGKILEESRAIKKGVPQYTYKDEKGVLETPNSVERVYQDTPNVEPEGKKGVLETPRSKEVVLHDKPLPTFEILYNRWLDNNLGELKPRQIEMFGDYYDEHPDWVADIMDMTIGGKPTNPWQYFVKIINSWVKNGRPTEQPATEGRPRYEGPVRSNSPPATAHVRNGKAPANKSSPINQELLDELQAKEAALKGQ